MVLHHTATSGPDNTSLISHIQFSLYCINTNSRARIVIIRLIPLATLFDAVELAVEKIDIEFVSQRCRALKNSLNQGYSSAGMPYALADISQFDFIETIMKVSRIKQAVTAIIATSMLVAGTASATPLLDLLIGSYASPNSGDKTVLAKLQTMTGNSYVNADLMRGESPVAVLNGDFWEIDLGSAHPEFFLLKFGIGGTKVSHDTYLFQNTGDLSKLAFSNEQVGFLTGGACTTGNTSRCNIGRLSHFVAAGEVKPMPETVPPPVTEISQEPDPEPTPVPEPAGIALIGAGLALMALRRRRRR